MFGFYLRDEGTIGSFPNEKTITSKILMPAIRTRLVSLAITHHADFSEKSKTSETNTCSMVF